MTQILNSWSDDGEISLNDDQLTVPKNNNHTESTGSILENITKKIIDVNITDSTPDLQTGELQVREAGYEEGKGPTKPITNFLNLNVDPELKKSILEVKGWQTMSKIQQIGLPLILNDPPKNLIGQAQAGTGKTGTFVIGMLARITGAIKPSSPQAIILCVSQELCTQIAQEVNILGQFKGIKARRIMSSLDEDVSWKIGTGEDFMEQVCVGTVGRTFNLLKADTVRRNKKKPLIDASDVSILILDEADQMVAAPPRGFGHQIKPLRDMIIKKRRSKPVQTLLFSATFAEDVRQEAQKIVGGENNDLTKYHEITLRKQDITLEKVLNFFIYIGSENETDENKIFQQKCDAIMQIWTNISEYNMGQTVIFCNKIARVQELTLFLQKQGIVNVGQLHGYMNKNERDVVLSEFKSGQRVCLVSTNLTSRGIDNPNVTLVINVDLPVNQTTNTPDVENFVHRIGRSGRWTKKGASVSLIARSPEFADLANIKEIERVLFANSDVNRPLILIDDVDTIGERLEQELHSIV